MIYDEKNSVAYHVLNQIGTWIKGEDETHVFQIDLKDVKKTFSVTIDCEQNNVVCVQQHGEFGIYEEHNISENLLRCRGHFDQDAKNEEIYWIDVGTFKTRIELELEFIQISIYYVVDEDENYEPLYSKSFEYKEE